MKMINYKSQILCCRSLGYSRLVVCFLDAPVIEILSIGAFILLFSCGIVSAEQINKNYLFLGEIKSDGWINAGNITNFNNPKDGINWGQQITDRNGLQFNQSVLRIFKDVKDGVGFDFGFKYSGLVGSDADYAQILGQTEYLINNRIQFVSPEAYVKIHLPILTSFGLNFKIGQFLAYNSIESLYAPENFFYTHSYTSEFGPWTTSGILGETKLSDNFEIYAGVITGFNTSIGWPGSYMSSPGVHAGFNLSLFNGELIVSGANISVPEQPKQLDPYNVGWPNGTIGGTPAECLCDPNNTWSYQSNLMFTFFPSDWLTLMADINYNRSDLAGIVSPYGLSNKFISEVMASGVVDNPVLSMKRSVQANSYGIATYGIYKINESISLGARVEYWRDDRNNFASVAPHPFDIANSNHGFPNDLIKREFGQGTSYIEVTFGGKIIGKFDRLSLFNEAIFRPQARFDFALNGTAPFYSSYQYGGKKTQGILSFDVILPFKYQK